MSRFVHEMPSIDHLFMVASAANSEGMNRPWEWGGDYPQVISRQGDAVLIANTYDSPDHPARMAEFIATFDPPTVLALLERAALASGEKRQ